MPSVRSELKPVGVDGAWLCLSRRPCCGSDLGSLWSKLGIAPWSYAGMWIGCNLGMLLGLLAMEAWQPVVSGSLQNLAVIMLVQMLLAMVAGMALVWWLAVQLEQRRIPGMLFMPRSSA